MKRLIQILFLITAASLTACSTPEEQGPQSKAVFMLLDTSGTYTDELNKAQRIINYLLARLNSGDTIAVARIDSGSFTEKDIIAKTTFDPRPSKTNEQKRAFKRKIDDFTKSVKSSSHTDISGGILLGSEYLTETNADQKYILVFSDLEEDLVRGHVRDFQIPLENINVIALNVTKLRSDVVDPREYLNRLSFWQSKVIDGGGEWRVVNDLDRLENIIKS